MLVIHTFQYVPWHLNENPAEIDALIGHKCFEMRIRWSQIVAFYGVCFKLLDAYHTVWRCLSDAILSNYVTFSILKYVNTSLLTSEVHNMLKILWNTQKTPTKHALRHFKNFLKIRFLAEKSGSRLRCRIMLKIPLCRFTCSHKW